MGTGPPPPHTIEGLDAARAIREEFPLTAILVLSAHAELAQATDLLGGGQRSGYLLKSRVIDVDAFVDALDQIVSGGTVVEPDLVRELVAARRVQNPLVAEGTVEKHVRSILMKLAVVETADNHRRVVAVLTYLGAL